MSFSVPKQEMNVNIAFWLSSAFTVLSGVRVQYLVNASTRRRICLYFSLEVDRGPKQSIRTVLNCDDGFTGVDT